MPGRFEYERAIRRSELLPLSRYLALMIATWADLETGIIPPEHQPAQSVLLKATGLSKSAFLDHRARLVEGGWISYISPAPEKARRENAQNEYFIHIPPGSPSDLAKTDMTPNSHQSDPRSAPDLGRQTTQGGSPSDLAEPREIRTSDPRSAPDLGRQATTRVPGLSENTHPEPFDTFWAAYPKRVGKGTARKAWAAALKRGADPQAIITAATRHAAAWTAAGTDRQWIPYPSSWLNGERYDDDQLPVARPATPQQPQQQTYADRGIF
ncbi:hypothetical protein [Kitasatospora sp. NPDC127116]|uniref:hypothetical protein n=1 Tax=Kitasatospora sp. NPDC127116 TaxID=3345367 RepID=UPI00363CD725